MFLDARSRRAGTPKVDDQPPGSRVSVDVSKAPKPGGRDRSQSTRGIWRSLLPGRHQIDDRSGSSSGIIEPDVMPPIEFNLLSVRAPVEPEPLVLDARLPAAGRDDDERSLERNRFAGEPALELGDDGQVLRVRGMAPPISGISRTESSSDGAGTSRRITPATSSEYFEA